MSDLKEDLTRLQTAWRVLVVAVLESVCATLDALPSWERDGGRLRRFKSGYGCRIGVARWAVALDDRWGTGVWKP